MGQIAVNQAAAGAALPVQTEGSGDDFYIQALQHFREYLKNSTGGRFSVEVADKLMSLGSGTAPRFTLTASDLDTIGLVYFKKGDYSRALNAWQSPQALTRRPATAAFCRRPSAWLKSAKERKRWKLSTRVLPEIRTPPVMTKLPMRSPVH